MLRITTLVLASLVLQASPAPAPPPEDGAALIRDMRARYDGQWYRTLTFVQTTTFANGQSQRWYEAIALPGRLRIDIAPVENRNVILFRSDSLYQFQSGALAGVVAQPHSLLILGFDVYHSPAEETIAKLEGLGFDLAVIREDVWQDRPVWVVGATEGDTTTAQFWIDQEHLYFVRMIRPADQNPAVTTEVLFDRYRRLGDGWIAPEVTFFSNGQRVLHEVYEDIRADVELPDDLFTPDPLAAPAWIDGE
jgi:hypothetical protein